MLEDNIFDIEEQKKDNNCDLMNIFKEFDHLEKNLI